MATPAWDDLAAFLNADDFAVPVHVDRQDGTTRDFMGIFDDPYLNAQLGEYEADTSRPRITCQQADVIGLTRGDAVTVDGRVFDLLSSPHADGTGMALLEMAPQEGDL